MICFQTLRASVVLQLTYIRIKFSFKIVISFKKDQRRHFILLYLFQILYDPYHKKNYKLIYTVQVDTIILEQNKCTVV